MTVVVPISREHRRRPRGRVLLVEDSFDELELYALILADAVDVLKASRGETGYALACATVPDVIVLDILMPDVDGWHVREWLRNNPVTARVSRCRSSPAMTRATERPRRVPISMRP